MFTKNNATPSLVEAVNKVLGEAEKKLLLEPEKKKEKKEVEEGWDDMMKAVKDRSGPQPSGGSGIKQGSRYGGSKQKDKPEHDDKKKVNEEDLDEAKFDPMKHIDKKNQTPDIKAAAKDVKRGSYGDRAALMKAGGVKDDRGPRGVTQEEVEQVEERTLTKGETSEKERIVKGMKKGLAGFKARYGDRAKSVMYATATKQAKNEELVGNQHKIDKNKNGKIDAQDFKMLRKEDVQLDEAVKTTHKDPLVAVHDTDGSLWTHANLSVANDIHGTDVHHKDVHAGPVKHGRWTFKISKHHESELAKDKAVNEQIGGISTISEKEKEDSILDTKTVDTLTGRKKVPSTFHNQHSDYKVKLAKEEKEEAGEKEGKEGHEDEKEDKALIDKEIDKKLKKSKLLKSLDKNGDGKHTDADHQKEQVSEGKGTDVDPTFATDANTTNSPLNLARGLAQKSFKKIKNEVMGKTGTSEEKKKW